MRNEETSDLAEKVSRQMKSHYSNSFETFGASSQGVDWGVDQRQLDKRYGKMLKLITNDERYKKGNIFSVLDVGSGFGGFRGYMEQLGIVGAFYSGVELCDNMVTYAQKNYPKDTFLCGDLFGMDDCTKYDYIICNGILTQKLDITIREMNSYANNIISKMFSMCNRGIAFNIMTSEVNFTSPNLYYRHPADTLIYCLHEITDKIVIDHNYELFEYTVYCYR